MFRSLYSSILILYTSLRLQHTQFQLRKHMLTQSDDNSALSIYSFSRKSFIFCCIFYHLPKTLPSIAYIECSYREQMREKNEKKKMILLVYIQSIWDMSTSFIHEIMQCRCIWFNCSNMNSSENNEKHGWSISGTILHTHST